MKIGKFARLLLAVTPFLAGCGNFWQPPSGSTGTGTTTTTLSSGNFYVLNLATRQIVGYNINSGSLNQIGAYTLSSAPNAIAIAPSGKFLYVSTVTGIYLYTIASNGALTIGYSGNVVSSDPAAAIAGIKWAGSCDAAASRRLAARCDRGNQRIHVGCKSHQFRWLDYGGCCGEKLRH